jgi:hypothetical protein
MNEYPLHQHHSTHEASAASDRRAGPWSDTVWEGSPDERGLVEMLSALSRHYAEQNTRSLARVWNRLIHSQDDAGWIWDSPLPPMVGGEQQMMTEEKRVMSDIVPDTSISRSGDMPARTALRWSSGRAFTRRLGVGVAAAALVVMVVSWAVIATTLHPGLHGYGTGTGPSVSSQPGATISTAQRRCSASFDTQTSMELGQPPLAWSAQGSIAAADPYLHRYSAQSCIAQSSINRPLTLVRPIWSPDGQRLLLLHGDVAEVVDAGTGQVLASLHADPGDQFTRAAWTPDSQQIVTGVEVLVSHTTENIKVQVWNAGTGGLVQTAFTFNNVLQTSFSISPNGQYLALEKANHQIAFWTISTGSLVSTTASTSAAAVGGNVEAMAWTPSGDALAIAVAQPTTSGPIQVWSAASGQLIASFTDSDPFEGVIEGLAWSPDGQYLAESSAEIHIWDLASRQLVVSFGSVPAKTASSTGVTSFSYIANVTWSPDSRGLASLTVAYPDNGGNGQATLNVWQLR